MASEQYYTISRMSKDDLQVYGQTRQQQYPTTYMNEHPSAKAEEGYNTYKARTEEANASVDRYWDSYEHQAGSYATPIDTLSQRQHGSLVYPAAEAATDTSSNAQAREDFLKEHTHGYRNARKRRHHEDLADSAFQDAYKYRDRYDTHLSGSIKEVEYYTEAFVEERGEPSNSGNDSGMQQTTAGQSDGWHGDPWADGSGQMRWVENGIWTGQTQ